MNAPAQRMAAREAGVLAVVPCLDEERNIGRVLARLLADRCVARIVVADGGSTDATRAIVARAAARNDRVVLLDNPDRIQSAGINRAVARHGAGHRWFARIDAHCDYPPDYVSRLVEAGERTGSQSVVVSMRTMPGQGFSASAAAAQNSRLGTGGSAHRMESEGSFVDHGHHALMRVAAFRRAGGYCENMPCNEDAELDVRLRRDGAHIWLEPSATIGYHPRGTPGALWRQYYRYGIGRATTVRRHRERMRLRQLVPLAVAPSVAALAAAPLAPILALPALAWAGLCQSWGAALAVRHRRADMVHAGSAAMIMHCAWSLGFWRRFTGDLVRPGGEGSEPLLPFAGRGLRSRSSRAGHDAPSPARTGRPRR